MWEDSGSEDLDPPLGKRINRNYEIHDIPIVKVIVVVVVVVVVVAVVSV